MKKIIAVLTVLVLVSSSLFAIDSLKDIMNDAAIYGYANWYFYNADKRKEKLLLEELLKSEMWSSFGYIAAEADYTRVFK